jgi:ER lumen protein retaining receptor
MGRKRASPVNVLFGWVRRQSMKVKILAGVVFALCSLVALKHSVKDHEYFFIFSEAIHAAGIFVLIYKLTTHKTCSGTYILVIDK